MVTLVVLAKGTFLLPQQPLKNLAAFKDTMKSVSVTPMEDGEQPRVCCHICAMPACIGYSGQVATCLAPFACLSRVGVFVQ